MSRGGQMNKKKPVGPRVVEMFKWNQISTYVNIDVKKWIRMVHVMALWID